MIDAPNRRSKLVEYQSFDRAIRRWWQLAFKDGDIQRKLSSHCFCILQIMLYDKAALLLNGNSQEILCNMNMMIIHCSEQLRERGHTLHLAVDVVMENTQAVAILHVLAMRNVHIVDITRTPRSILQVQPWLLLLPVHLLSVE